MKSFNINNSVWIKPTDKGREVYKLDRLQYVTIWKFEPRKENSKGFSKWQLWEVMQLFGSHIALGIEIPFEPTIYFSEPVDNDV